MSDQSAMEAVFYGQRVLREMSPELARDFEVARWQYYAAVESAFSRALNAEEREICDRAMLLRDVQRMNTTQVSYQVPDCWHSLGRDDQEKLATAPFWILCETMKACGGTEEDLKTLARVTLRSKDGFPLCEVDTRGIAYFPNVPTPAQRDRRN